MSVVAAVGCAREPVEGGDRAELDSTRKQTFTAFETGQVRPLVLSADRRFVYATNTPDNRVEIFRVAGRHLAPVGSVAVGLEPVALAERAAGELWVVNHLSDSVSVVDVTDPARAHVTRTRVHYGSDEVI